jgi:hypothetical protein
MMNKLKIAAFGIVTLLAGNSYAQVCHNMFPYVQGVVNDNNGYDLVSYVKNSAKDVAVKAAKINEYSGGEWGYIQVKVIKAPSVEIERVNDKYVKNHLNFSQPIDATLAMCNTKEGMKATWWARQCNNSAGPLFYKKADDAVKTDMPIVYYTDVTKELAAKKFTLVEYNNETYNRRDYDQMLKNYITLENGIVKDAGEYKTIIDFYNNFLSKFGYVSDPLLEDKSFVTFFTAGKNRYAGYFNIENSKLSGHLEPVDIQYEKDKDTVVNNTFKKLTGKTIYVYGDDIYGMQKNMLRYGHLHNVKLIRRKTNTNKKFNG